MKSDSFGTTKIYDKRNDFHSDIVNFPFLDVDVPRSVSTGVNISQRICFVQVCNCVDNCNLQNKVLTAILVIGIITFVIIRRFQNFINDISSSCLNIMSA